MKWISTVTRELKKVILFLMPVRNTQLKKIDFFLTLFCLLALFPLLDSWQHRYWQETWEARDIWHTIKVSIWNQTAKIAVIWYVTTWLWPFWLSGITAVFLFDLRHADSRKNIYIVKLFLNLTSSLFKLMYVFIHLSIGFTVWGMCTFISITVNVPVLGKVQNSARWISCCSCCS